MKVTEAMARIDVQARAGRCVLTCGDLARILGEPRGTSKVNQTLRRLVASGYLARPTRGVYVVRHAADADVLPDMAMAARPHEAMAVSLETAASAWGLVPHLFPSLLTVATCGRSGSVESEWGRIEFTHTGMGPDALMAASAATWHGLPMTDERTTMRLLRRAGRRQTLGLVEGAAR